MLRVPFIITRAPWQRRRKRVEEIVQGPSDDYVVIDTYNSRYDDHAISDSWNIIKSKSLFLTTYIHWLSLAVR